MKKAKSLRKAIKERDKSNPGNAWNGIAPNFRDLKITLRENVYRAIAEEAYREGITVEEYAANFISGNFPIKG